MLRSPGLAGRLRGAALVAGLAVVLAGCTTVTGSSGTAAGSIARSRVTSGPVTRAADLRVAAAKRPSENPPATALIVGAGY